ncbi:unnamed protein product [Pedinophyceae sp. YPF-701]|nr:unnamed protein product [Pedinophyceae sp. YPF-701]
MGLGKLFRGLGGGKGAAGREDKGAPEEDTVVPVDVPARRRGVIDVRRSISEPQLNVRRVVDGPSRPEDAGAAAPSMHGGRERGGLQDGSKTLIERGTVHRKDLGRMVPQVVRPNYVINRSYSVLTGEPCVVKVYGKAALQPSELLDARAEVANLRKLKDARYLLKYLGDWETDQSLALVLEQYGQGTLAQALDQAPAKASGQVVRHLWTRIESEEAFVERVAIPLLMALVEMHSQNICHRRIDPEHLFFSTDGVVKVAGMGSAMDLASDRAVSRIGKEGYIAPEVANKPTLEDIFHACVFNGVSEEQLESYDEQCDVWSYGRVLLECLLVIEERSSHPWPCKEPASEDADDDDDIPQEMSAKLARLRHVSATCKSYLRRCLRTDPASRPPAFNLAAAPWVQKHIKMNEEFASVLAQAREKASRRSDAKSSTNNLRASMHRYSMEHARAVAAKPATPSPKKVLEAIPTFSRVQADSSTGQMAATASTMSDHGAGAQHDAVDPRSHSTVNAFVQRIEGATSLFS